MCIIVFKPKGEKLDKDILERCYNRNSDGSGFAYPMDGKFSLHKDLGKFERIWKPYKNEVIDKGIEKDIPVLWHFRIRTHGKISLDNIHPFILNSGQMVIAHNGIIKGGIVPHNSKESDTLKFKLEVLDQLEKLGKNWIQNLGVQELFKEYIGFSSKVIFLDINGHHTIYNEDDGEWDKGIWYSNTGYKEYKYGNGVTRNNTWNRLNNVYNIEDDSCYNGYNNIYNPKNQSDIEISRSGNNIGIKRNHCKYCTGPLKVDREKEMGICPLCVTIIIQNRKTFPNYERVY